MSALKRLIPLAPARSVARRAASLAIFIVFASPALAIVALALADSYRAGRPLHILARSAALYVSVLVGVWTMRALASLYERYAQARYTASMRAALHNHLRVLSLDPDAKDDPRVELARSAFWSERQRQSITALQQRAQRHSPHSDLLGVALRSSRVLHYGVGIIVCILLLGYIAALIAARFFDTSLGHERSIDSAMFVLTCMVGALGGYALASCAVMGWLRSGAQQLALKREVRRVEELAELSGGLTLADEEVEALLRGALSSDAAQGGELEEVP